MRIQDRMVDHKSQDLMLRDDSLALWAICVGVTQAHCILREGDIGFRRES
jgi:hypothetical protein